MTDDINKLLKPLLSQEEIVNEKLYAAADEELAQLSAALPHLLRAPIALRRALERRIGECSK
jgi:hypothetical protein